MSGQCVRFLLYADRCGLVERRQRISWAMERDALMSITVVAESFPSKNLESRILQLYVWELMAKRFVNGYRTASLARYGTYEVRLVEPLPDLQNETIPFWIELFDHGNDVTIDSCGSELEEAAVGAESLISQAKLLHRDSASAWLWRRGSKPCGWSRAWSWIRGECLFMKGYRGILAR